jgi:hypothetical protein
MLVRWGRPQKNMNSMLSDPEQSNLHIQIVLRIQSEYHVLAVFRSRKGGPIQALLVQCSCQNTVATFVFSAKICSKID